MKKFFQKKDSGEKEKIKEVKPKKSKKVKTSREIQFSRKKVTRSVTLLVFLVICLSLVFNVIFFSKYQTIRNTVKAGENKIEKQLNQVKKTGILNSNSVVTFTENFLKEYYNIPDKKEERDQRLEDLAAFFVNGFDTSTLETIEEFNGSRTLKNVRYVETKRIDKNNANVHFLVNYDITEIEVIEKEIEVKKKEKDKNGEEKEVTEKKTVQEEKPTTINDSVEVVVPVITNGDGFAVTGSPSLISRNFKANIKQEENTIEGQEVASSEREQLKGFLTDFFTSYGVSDEKLPFMAKVERGLEGKIFSNIGIEKAYEDDGVYKIIVDVNYQNKETSFTSLYTYYLVASKNKNKYFIEEIKQGGF